MTHAKLHQLQAPGSTRAPKRIGRGESSGHGKTAGRGQKGQRARSGGRVRPGFEGGQMPLFRRLPKFRQNKLRTAPVQIINLRDLNRVQATHIDHEVLQQAHLIANPRGRVKVLAMGEVNRALTLVVDHISRAARTKIVNGGGRVIMRSQQKQASGKQN